MSEEVNKKDKNTESRKKNNFKPFILFSILLVFSLFFILSAKGFDIKELLPVKHNVFVKGPNMHVYHNGPAILLDDGNVLIIGGESKQVELYNTKNNEFVITKNEMITKRVFGSAATKLQDGNVFISGGVKGDNCRKTEFGTITCLPKHIYYVADNAEIYNRKTHEFTEMSKMVFPRFNHFSHIVNNGNVLIFGGENNDKKNISEIEEFDLKTKKFKIIAKLTSKIKIADVIKLKNDKFLIVEDDNRAEIPNTIIFNYKNNKFESIDLYDKDDTKYYFKLNTQVWVFHNNTIKKLPRIINSNKVYYNNIDYFTLTKLDEDRAIIIGGLKGSGDFQRTLDTTEMVMNDIICENNTKLNNPRKKHMAISLENGNILVLGGSSKFDKHLLTTEFYIK